MSKFELGLNPLWLLLCLAVALGFSLFLYFRFKSIWPQKWNVPLGILRFLGVFTLLFLLLNPLIRSIENQTQKPKIHILVDNSESLMIVDPTLKTKISATLSQLTEALKPLEYELFDLEDVIKSKGSINYSRTSTNLNQAIQNSHNLGAGEHQVATILISDGIVNQGLGLKDIISSKPIFAIGVGDTNKINDVFISELYVNKTSYKGNEFPVQVSVQAKGYKGKSSKVVFKVEGQIVDSKVVNFKSNNDLIDLNFNYTSKKAGHLKVECIVEAFNDEKIKVNNHKSRYVLVKDGRKKIAIVAASPHPDIKAIKTSIEKLDKYEVELIILSFGAKTPDIKGIDAFILHQVPCRNCSGNLLNQIIDSKKPLWYITGLQSDYASFNKYNKVLTVKGLRGVDHVGGKIKSDFDLFTTEEFDFDYIQHAAPLKAPFSDLDLSPGTQVLFEQTIGTTSNGKALMAYNHQTNKEFVTLGEGIWQWKMFEYLEYENTNNFDLMISKIIGLIDGNQQETQFEVLVQKESYLESEKPSFAVTVKNELGELIYDQPIDLLIKRKDTVISKMNFKVSASDPFYKLSSLKEGIYTYVATTKVGGKTLKDAGSFSVSDLKLESKDLRADFDGLQTLSKNSKGEFYAIDKVDVKQLAEKLKQYPSKIISFEQEKFFNELFWILVLILSLFSIEWIARKYLGDV
jgi:hypothetical protein